MKICSLGAMLFHLDRQTDRQTDMTKLVVVVFFFLLQFCKCA